MELPDLSSLVTGSPFCLQQCPGSVCVDHCRELLRPLLDETSIQALCPAAIPHLKQAAGRFSLYGEVKSVAVVPLVVPVEVAKSGSRQKSRRCPSLSSRSQSHLLLKVAAGAGWWSPASSSGRSWAMFCPELLVATWPEAPWWSGSSSLDTTRVTSTEEVVVMEEEKELLSVKKNTNILECQNNSFIVFCIE